MDWIWWIVVGAIAGLLAQWLMGGERGGWIITILLGIVGAWVGGFVMRFFELGGAGPGAFWWSILVATLGAVILLFLKQVLFKK